MIAKLNNISSYIRAAGIDKLNAMQEAAINSIDEERDIIISAPTGSGKTIAFLSMLLKLVTPEASGTFALIVTPTRELALQITEVFQKMKTGYKVTTCYGGHKREIEENNLIESPFLIIGTPGRIGDHIRRKNIGTDDIRVLILDEFDKSLEMGFLEEMEFIFNSLQHLRRKILVSATPLKALPPFLTMEQALAIGFTEAASPRLKLNRTVFDDKENKLPALLNVLCTVGNRRTIIFANQKETVKTISDFLADNGIYTVSYHGSMEQRERETAITKFRNGTSLFLVTTDLASRGLDIAHIRFIIHYDLPDNEQVFVHRNGRTARMEASGEVILLTGRQTAIPDFLPEDIDEFSLVPGRSVPDKTEWGTLYISAGKKDKINKVDIAGFLMKQCDLRRDDTGLIEVRDFYSFAAVRKSKMNSLLGKGKGWKIKNQKVKIEAAR